METGEYALKLLRVGEEDEDTKLGIRELEKCLSLNVVDDYWRGGNVERLQLRVGGKLRIERGGRT